MTVPHKISAAGITLVKHYEGLYLHAYRCPAGVLTIGWGHTGKDVTMGEVITPERAEALLEKDLAGAAADVSRLVVVPLAQEEFDALVSFTFNLGAGALAGSTLLRVLNQGEYDEVPDQLLRWDHCKGQVLDGLRLRRQVEAKLWEDGMVWMVAHPGFMPQTADDPDGEKK